MNNSFNWCGYDWGPEMEGGRLIHPDEPWMWNSCSESVIKHNEDGSLELSLCYNPKEIKYWDGRVFNPVIETSLMRTNLSFGFGKFSVDIKLPKGKKLKPSFWLSGDGNWPPEIDIMEAWGSSNNYFRMTQPIFPWIKPQWWATNNVHYRDNNLEHKHITSLGISLCKMWRCPDKEFNNYEVTWLPDSITFKINGKTVREVDKNVCKMLITNLNHPDHGYNMDVIFNVHCEDTSAVLKSPMIIKNFKYEKA